jgi:hypothetical protein
MSDHTTEHNSVYLLDLAVLAALERVQAGHENDLQVVMDEYQLDIDDNIALWRNLVEVAAVQIAVLSTEFLGVANAVQLAQSNVDRYLERD